METAAGLGLPSPHLDYSRPAAEMILSPGNNSDRVVEQAMQPPRYEKKGKEQQQQHKSADGPG
jgi:hypothetical protein